MNFNSKGPSNLLQSYINFAMAQVLLQTTAQSYFCAPTCFSYVL